MSINSLYSSPLLYKMRFMVPAVTTTVAGMLAHKEQVEKQTYRKALESKLDYYSARKHESYIYNSFAQSNDAYEQELVSAQQRQEVVKDNGWFSWLTQLLILKTGTPVKLGRTGIYSDSVDEIPVGIVTHPFYFFKDKDQKEPMGVLTYDNYSLLLSPQFYQAIKASFRPLNFIPFIREKGLGVSYTNEATHHRIELEMSPKLWRNLFKGILYHETAHVNDIIYNQNGIGLDISLCQAEQEADAHVKKPHLIKPLLADLNFQKIRRIYCVWPYVFSEHNISYKEPSLEYLSDYDSLYEMALKAESFIQNQPHSSDDYYPSQNERIQAFEKQLGDNTCTGDQEVIIRIYHQEKLQHTLILKENENFSVEKTVSRLQTNI